MTYMLQTSKEEGVSGFEKGADLSSCLEAIRSPEVAERPMEKKTHVSGNWVPSLVCGVSTRLGFHGGKKRREEGKVFDTWVTDTEKGFGFGC
ncbi:hypothetical protein EV1_002708 [Malus domestica]